MPGDSISGQVEADVVVVGAGLAGLTAAQRLRQAGRRALVLEAGRDEDYACNSRSASGSFNLAHCDPTADPEALYQAILADTEGAAELAQARAIARVAGAAMQWFRSEGAEFVKIGRAGKEAANWSLAPPRPSAPGFGWKGRGPDVALGRLRDRFTASGGQLALGARARDLTMANGACVGLVAERDGAKIEVKARHVVLADGGFQANPDLLKRFISPRPDCLVQRNARTGRGDALIMAERAGAKLVNTDRFYGHLLVQEALNNDLLWPYPTIDTLASSAIVVDGAGRRFLDEGLGGVAMANLIARKDDPLCAIAVFDDAIWRTTGKLEFTPPNPYVISSGGTVTSAPTLDELGQALRLPPGALSATIAAYNDAVQGRNGGAIEPPRSPGRMFGVLRSSSARTQPLPIVAPPFHAIRLCAGVTYTMGGVAIDEQARALDLQGRPIRGLYAVGSCSGGVEGGPIAGYIGGLCKALSLGFIAAQAIVAQT